MDLWFLGTGAGIPSQARNVTAIALTWFQERGTFWLFDCGEATQHQLMQTPLSLAKLEKVFITHLHGDHLFGLPGLLGSRSFSGSDRPLQLYGPPGLKDFVDAALKASQTHLSYLLEVQEVSLGPVCADEQCEVSCLALDHGILSLGYRLVERDLPGRLDVKALQRAGVSPGPVYGQLKQGEFVALDDGRLLSPADFVGPPQSGRVIAVLGDTRPTDAGRQLAEGADVLVHEATFGSEQMHLAPVYGHCTAADAARAAQAAGAGQLVLTHISARYSDADALALLDEARAIFPATAIAHDLMRLTVERAEHPG